MTVALRLVLDVDLRLLGFLEIDRKVDRAGPLSPKQIRLARSHLAILLVTSFGGAGKLGSHANLLQAGGLTL